MANEAISSWWREHDQAVKYPIKPQTLKRSPLQQQLNMMPPAELLKLQKQIAAAGLQVPKAEQPEMY